ncbi:MAG: PEP-CTERM sorting domain-containing protein [Candidatus Thiodiazotropha sp. (ex Monitilora ramsayi)]|nr:PEP-CTERM sorting domain-containing protein [Candidatus Thiodiazotropha sp. (ex Monitilora ramsayi)]
MMLFSAGSLPASVIVTNDWATATVQLRDQKGGAVQASYTTQGETGFDIDAESPGGDFAHAEINRTTGSGSLVTARVVTDDTAAMEVEAWLETSWLFSVTDTSADFRIGLFVDIGGEFTSGFSLYDLSNQALVSTEALFSYGYIGAAGTLLAGHDYLFKASIPRVDGDELRDLVYDGTSGLDFSVDAEIIYNPDRTHIQISVPEPSPMLSLFVGLGLLGLVKWSRC